MWSCSGHSGINQPDRTVTRGPVTTWSGFIECSGTKTGGEKNDNKLNGKTLTRIRRGGVSPKPQTTGGISGGPRTCHGSDALWPVPPTVSTVSETEKDNDVVCGERSGADWLPCITQVDATHRWWLVRSLFPCKSVFECPEKRYIN